LTLAKVHIKILKWASACWIQFNKNIAFAGFNAILTERDLDCNH